jgi:multiple sugar transport system permease protein
MVRRIFFAFAVLLLMVFCLLPFVQMLSVSFKYSWEWGTPSLIPDRINKDAYGELINPDRNVREPYPIMHFLLDESRLTQSQKNRILRRYREAADIFPFALYFRNSFLLSFLSALAATFLATLGAFSLGRLRLPERSFINRMVLMVYLLGGVLMAVPLYRMGAAAGLLKTPGGTAAALLLIYLVQVLPVALYLLGNYFRAIPRSLDDAGRIDGLSRGGVLMRLIVPLSRNALTTVFIYCFIIVWNDYLYASIFLKSYPRLRTLALGIRFLFYSKNAVWDRIMAASILTALPVILLFWSIQSNLERGFTEGLKE